MKTICAFLFVFVWSLYGQVTPSTTLFQLHGVSTEATSMLTGAVVTPAIGPPGVLIVNGTGAVSYSPSGVSFSACCASVNNAFYSFVGLPVGNLFTAAAGQINLVLTSRYSYADRLALTTGFRSVFKVQDVIGAPGVDQFGLTVQASPQGITFSYGTGGKSSNFYVVPAATADSIFGVGQSAAISMSWTGTTFSFSLNGAVVKTSAYTPPAFAWSATSTLLIGAQPYNGAGYNVDDDSISEFVIMGTAVAPPPPPPPPPQTLFGVPCSGIYNSALGTLSITCDGSVLVAPVPFTSATMLIQLTGTGAQWQIDARKFLAAFGSNP